jgi:hypothetical protein
MSDPLSNYPLAYRIPIQKYRRSLYIPMVCRKVSPYILIIYILVGEGIYSIGILLPPIMTHQFGYKNPISPTNIIFYGGIFQKQRVKSHRPIRGTSYHSDSPQ